MATSSRSTKGELQRRLNELAGPSVAFDPLWTKSDLLSRIRDLEAKRANEDSIRHVDLALNKLTSQSRPSSGIGLGGYGYSIKENAMAAAIFFGLLILLLALAAPSIDEEIKRRQQMYPESFCRSQAAEVISGKREMEEYERACPLNYVTEAYHESRIKHEMQGSD